MEKVQLFCLPFAGGSANFYNEFKKYLSDNIELFPIELKGHGRRLSEECNYVMRDIVNDAVNEILKVISLEPFAIFGYSMGATVCYESYKLLLSKIKRKPVHMFFAANSPPHERESNSDCHLWSNSEFLNKMKKLGGIPDEVLNEPELLNMILPILKADVQAENEYDCDFPLKVDCNISVIYSPEDVEQQVIAGWKNYTKGSSYFYPFSGNHFFIKSNLKYVVDIINKTLVENNAI